MKLFHLLSFSLALKCDQKIFQNEMQPCMKSNWFLLFVIYQRIFVLSIIRQQNYSIYLKKKEKGKKHLELMLKRENYTVCSTFEIPQTVNKLDFSCKEMHASFCLISPGSVFTFTISSTPCSVKCIWSPKPSKKCPAPARIKQNASGMEHQQSCSLCSLFSLHVFYC